MNVREMLAVFVAMSAASSGGDQAKRLPANPRELPSLTQKWTWKGKAENAVLVDDVIYIRGDGRVTALRAAAGSVLWDRVCVEGVDHIGQGPLVVQDGLAVSFDGKLVLMDRGTGRIRKTLTVGGVSQITAPLLLAVAGQSDGADLVRIDSETGEVLARTEAGAIVYDVETVGDVAVAIVGRKSSARGESDDEILVGYRTGDLRELWRVPFNGLPHLEWINGALYAAALVGEGDDSRLDYRPVDPGTGVLGKALPPRLKSEVSGGLTWELELVGLREGKSPARLRRNSIETGQPIWTIELPGDPSGWVRDGNSLYLHCDHEGGRGYVVVLDWDTGAVKHAAFGLRDVRGLFWHHDTLISWSDGGLSAVSASVGPSAKHTVNLGEEVIEILRGVSDGDLPSDREEHIKAGVTDLKTLGPRALPFVAKEVSRLAAPALVAAARVLGDGAYRDAAPLLAARLPDPPPPPKSEWDHWDPVFDLLMALSRLGGDREVTAVAKVLNDGTKSATRRQALATLASIGTPGAIPIIERTLAHTSAPARWWQPASAETFADLIGRQDLEALEQTARERNDSNQMERIDRASGGARIALAGGGALLLFHDARLGGHKDLWVVEMDADGRARAPAAFVGASAEGPIKASFNGEVLVIERTNGGGPLQLSLADVGKDTDGDGLADLVELRLRTDPQKPDSDGDGLRDSEDPAPNGAAKAKGEQDEIVASIFKQFFMFESSPSETAEPAIMVYDSALQWEGRRGPTITLSEKENEAFLEEAGTDGIAHISIEPGRQRMGRGETDEEEATSAPDERYYKLTVYRGGLNAVGYDITVRKLDGQWVIRECRFAWVS